MTRKPIDERLEKWTSEMVSHTLSKMKDIDEDGNDVTYAVFHDDSDIQTSVDSTGTATPDENLEGQGSFLCV